MDGNGGSRKKEIFRLSGRRHVEKAAEVTPSKQEKVCEVCGDTAHGKYFSATVCLPCKSFYIRCTKLRGMEIQRQWNGRCDISKDLRHRCQYCRFKRCLQIGMTRKERPEMVVAEAGQQLCRVCGDLANGVHFGVFTCEGCKKFFLRSLKEHKNYLCRGQGNCSLNPRNRNHCRRCRFVKCSIMGMSRNAIKMGRPPKPNTSTVWSETAPLSAFHTSPTGHGRLFDAWSTSSRPLLISGSLQGHEELPVQKDVKLHRQRGPKMTSVLKNSYAHWAVPYKKRENRSVWRNEPMKKIWGLSSSVPERAPFVPPVLQTSSVDCTASQIPVVISHRKENVGMVISSSANDQVHTRLPINADRATRDVSSRHVNAPIRRAPACFSRDSTVPHQSNNTLQKSLHASFSPAEPFSPPCTQSHQRKKQTTTLPLEPVFLSAVSSCETPITPLQVNSPGMHPNVAGLKKNSVYVLFFST